MSITFNDDEDIEAFLPAAQSAIRATDAVPPAESLLNGLWLERGVITSDEFSLLRRAIQKPHGLLGYLRAWWAA